MTEYAKFKLFTPDISMSFIDRNGKIVRCGFRYYYDGISGSAYYMIVKNGKIFKKPYGISANKMFKMIKYSHYRNI